MQLNHERSFFEKLQKLLTDRAVSELHGGGYSEHSIAIHSISVASNVERCTGYCLFRTPSPKGKQFQ